MSETKRRTPAIPERPERPVPAPEYARFPFFQEPPPLANPVILFRTRLLSELDIEPLPEGRSQYFRFPYLDASLFPASPVIPIRSRLLSELSIPPLPEGSRPRFLPFPYLDASLFPASPVLPFRHGQDILADIPAFVAAQFTRFPFFQEEAPPPTNPVISYRHGQDILEAFRAFVAPHFLPFPYFQEPPLAANPVIPIRSRLLSELAIPPLPEASYPQYLPVFQPPPLAANPVLPILVARDILADIPAFVAPHFLPFPYFQEPGLVSPLASRRLADQWMRRLRLLGQRGPERRRI